MYQLRPYQNQAVEQIRQAFRAGAKAPLFVLPTGGGKTHSFCYIAQNAAYRGKRVWILVHRRELIRQASAKLHEAGIPHGIINAKYQPSYHDLVQVASVQSLKPRMHKIPFQPDLIIIDEAHHANASTYVSIFKNYPQARLLGVTATPCRTDESGLGVASGGFFDCMVQGPQIHQLIDMGYLARPVVFAPSTVDLSGVHTRGGDYATNELAALLDKPTITGDAVKHYSKICPGEPAVAFCASVEHAKHVAAEFRAAGYRFYHVDGNLPDDQRDWLIKNLGTPAVQGLTSCDLISEGTDIPAISCAILLRPTQSLGLFLQQIGRALRTSPGKSRAIILDHVGNVIRHGMPDEHRIWSLDAESRKTRKKKDKEERKIPTRQCPKCYAVHKPTPTCPMCGHTYITEGREVNQVDGELREITEADRARLRRQRAQERAKAKSLEELEELARRRGYKPGWAKYIWKARQEKHA